MRNPPPRPSRIIRLLTVLALGMIMTFVPLLSRLRTEAGSSPSLVICNARIWTVNSEQPNAQALAVQGDRILAVGTDDEIRSLCHPSTRLIDGRGRTVLPGFIDAHFHLLDLKPPKRSINLRWVASRQELVDSVAKHARSVPQGEWIFGEGWDERKWGGELPSKTWIDPVTRHNPVWLLRNYEGAGLANSLALEAAGITQETPDDSSGGILVDSAGRPTGLIRGGPMWLIDRRLISQDQEAGKQAEERMHRLCELGITSIHHTGNWQELLIFQALHREGRG